MLRRSLITYILLLFANTVLAQEEKTDSLKKALEQYETSRKELNRGQGLHDTVAVELMLQLSKLYRGSDPQQSMYYATSGEKRAISIGDKKGWGGALSCKGVLYWYKGEYDTALFYFEQSLKLRNQIQDLPGISESHNGIGTIYYQQGNYPLSLKHFLASLKIREQLGDKKLQAGSYNNIGLIYNNQGNKEMAMKMYKKSLALREETGDRAEYISSHINIGNLYFDLGNYPEALKHHTLALEIAREQGNKKSIGDAYNNIGNNLKKQGKYEEALKNFFASLEIRKEQNEKYGISYSQINIGEVYLIQKKYAEARKVLNQALNTAKELGDVQSIMLSELQLSRLDSATGDFKSALAHYKSYIINQDSLVNLETTQKITAQQLQFEYDKKEAQAKANQEKKDEKAREETRKQKMVRNGLLAGFGVVLLFATVVLRQRNRISREKKISEEEKKRSEELLLNILPAEVAEEIKTTGRAKAKAFTMVTVMFTDFKDFTHLSERISSELLVDEINTCFSAFDTILQKHRIEKIKTIGDAYLCVGGLPVSNFTHASDMLEAAFEIREFMETRRKEKESRGETAFELRIGIHTGPVVAGVVGLKKYAYDIWGDTVNVAARMEQHSEAGKINISGSTYELVKEKCLCHYRGKIEAKNKGEIDMYFADRK